jgi:hypothetical protein
MGLEALSTVYRGLLKVLLAVLWEQANRDNPHLKMRFSPTSLALAALYSASAILIALSQSDA